MEFEVLSERRQRKKKNTKIAPFKCKTVSKLTEDKAKIDAVDNMVPCRSPRKSNIGVLTHFAI